MGVAVASLAVAIFFSGNASFRLGELLSLVLHTLMRGADLQLDAYEQSCLRPAPCTFDSEFYVGPRPKHETFPPLVKKMAPYKKAPSSRS